ncbi:MAG: hypothetical protein ACQPRI_06335, partial [Solitalea-like symbiont of Tyrophagus putrescentiae]
LIWYQSVAAKLPIKKWWSKGRKVWEVRKMKQAETLSTMSRSAYTGGGHLQVVAIYSGGLA